MCSEENFLSEIIYLFIFSQQKWSGWKLVWGTEPEIKPPKQNGSQTWKFVPTLRPWLDGVHYNCPTSQRFVLQTCAKMFRQIERERERETERKKTAVKCRTSLLGIQFKHCVLYMTDFT